ncbi:UPF0045 protein M15, partial [Spiromyces aspiralis]
MYVAAEIQMVPVGTESSLTKYIAKCKEVFDRWGIKYEMHAMGTNFVAKYEDVMKIGQECIQAVLDSGAPRVVVNFKISARRDKDICEEGDGAEKVKHYGK